MTRQGPVGTDVQVLLIGDEPVVDCGVDLLLTAHHLRIQAKVSDGLEAAQVLQTCRPHVVVLNLTLGDEALACVRVLQEAAPALPVLAYGGRRAWSIQELFDAGVRGFALTDTEPEEFVEAIRTVAGGGIHLDPGFALAERGDPARGDRPPLSARERQILGLLAYGLTGTDVAERLCISHATVRTHVQNAMRKLGARTRAHAIAILSGEAGADDRADMRLAG